MKTFKQFVEHHQTDANGKVIEHGDGTPSSVEEGKKPKNCGCGQDPCVTYGKGDKKKGHNCASKVKHEEYGMGNCIKEMHTLDENGNVTHYDVRFSNKIVRNIPVSSLEIMEELYHEHVVNEGKNRENYTPHKMIDPSSKKEYWADTYDKHMKYKKMGYIHEAKQEKGRSDYGKASVRNKRRFGKEGEPAVFDASGERGKMIDQRRAEHKAKRGVKEEVDAYKYVVSKLKKKYGSGVLTKGDKIKPQSAADKAKARAHQAKVDAENAAARAKDPSQGRYPKG